MHLTDGRTARRLTTITPVNVDVLERVELFRPLPRADLARLAERGALRRFAPGTALMRQGETGETMHVIVAGLVRVDRWLPDERIVKLAELGAGEIVGEMGLLDRAPRSATVTAIEPTETLELHATALAVVLIENPDVSSALLRTLSRRLRSADELVVEMSRAQKGRI
jgi:CRP-like cAMP-binding protein